MDFEYTWIIPILVAIVWNIFKKKSEAEKKGNRQQNVELWKVIGKTVEEYLEIGSDDEQKKEQAAKPKEASQPDHRAEANRPPEPSPESLPEMLPEQLEVAVPSMSVGSRGAAAPVHAAQRPTRAAHPELLTKQNLKRAVFLREVLGEPRSKQPWRPNRKGR